METGQRSVCAVNVQFVMNFLERLKAVRWMLLNTENFSDVQLSPKLNSRIIRKFDDQYSTFDDQNLMLDTEKYEFFSYQIVSNRHFP